MGHINLCLNNIFILAYGLPNLFTYPSCYVTIPFGITDSRRLTYAIARVADALVITNHQI